MNDRAGRGLRISLAERDGASLWAGSVVPPEKVGYRWPFFLNPAFEAPSDWLAENADRAAPPKR